MDGIWQYTSCCTQPFFTSHSTGVLILIKNYNASGILNASNKQLCLQNKSNVNNTSQITLRHKKTTDSSYVYHLRFIRSNLWNPDKTAEHKPLQTKRLPRDKELKSKYHRFVQEYQQLGHMQAIEPNESESTRIYIIQYSKRPAQLPPDLSWTAMPTLSSRIDDPTTLSFCNL